MSKHADIAACIKLVILHVDTPRFIRLKVFHAHCLCCNRLPLVLSNLYRKELFAVAHGVSLHAGCRLASAPQVSSTAAMLETMPQQQARRRRQPVLQRKAGPVTVQMLDMSRSELPSGSAKHQLQAHACLLDTLAGAACIWVLPIAGGLSNCTSRSFAPDHLHSPRVSHTVHAFLLLSSSHSSLHLRYAVAAGILNVAQTLDSSMCMSLTAICASLQHAYLSCSISYAICAKAFEYGQETVFGDAATLSKVVWQAQQNYQAQQWACSPLCEKQGMIWRLHG